MPIRDMRVYLRVPAPRNSIHFHFHVVYTEPRASVRRIIREALVWYQQTAHQSTIHMYVRSYARNECVPAHRAARVRYHFINHAEDRSQPAATERWECTLIEITI